MKEYRLFLAPNERPEENKEKRFNVVDASTLEALEVKAVVSSSLDALPGADRLWLHATGTSRLIEEKPWAIKTIETIEEAPQEVTVRKQKTSLGRMKGSILETLIRQREEKSTPG